MRALIVALFVVVLAGCPPIPDVEPDHVPVAARKPVVVMSSRIGNAEGQTDADFAADPPAAPSDKLSPILQAIDDADHAPWYKANECGLKTWTAEQARGECAAQMAQTGCAKAKTSFAPGECSKCDEWTKLDAAQCPAYPPYRLASDK